MAEIYENTKPITFEEFIDRVKKNVHAVKGYYSLYITPKGGIIDCRYPMALDHNNFSAHVYNNLSQLSENIYDSCLRGFDIPFEDTAYWIEDYYELLNVQYDDADLFNQIDKVLLGTEDRICQDMGFVKVAINTKMKTYQVTIPNTSFKRFVTAHQKEVIEQLSEAFNMDIDVRLKSEQKENMKLATKIKPIVDKYTSNV